MAQYIPSVYNEVKRNGKGNNIVICKWYTENNRNIKIDSVWVRNGRTY
jgi:hypothetical protein